MEESDTGGLDMYVDIPDDAKGALLSSQDEGDDDTGEIPYEWTRDESNEGSNLSGEQNMSLSGQEGAFQGGFSFFIVFIRLYSGMEISSCTSGGSCLNAKYVAVRFCVNMKILFVKNLFFKLI